MGWVVDVQWSDLARTRRRFGIVDAVRVMHHGAVGSDYARGGTSADRSGLLDALHQRGVQDTPELQEVLNLRRPWTLFTFRP